MNGNRGRKPETKRIRGGNNRKRKNIKPDGISEAKINWNDIRGENAARMKKEKRNPGGKSGFHGKGKRKWEKKEKRL